MSEHPVGLVMPRVQALSTYWKCCVVGTMTVGVVNPGGVICNDWQETGMSGVYIEISLTRKTPSL